MDNHSGEELEAVHVRLGELSMEFAGLAPAPVEGPQVSTSFSRFPESASVRWRDGAGQGQWAEVLLPATEPSSVRIEIHPAGEVAVIWVDKTGLVSLTTGTR